MVTDEETPLLREAQTVKTKRTPLPVLQLSVLLLLQAAEPFTSHVIYPFAPQLVRDIEITGGDETRVGYYVGVLAAVFFLAQAFTVLQWSRLSDHIGRRPVIIGGLFGLSFTMMAFGLSKSFVGLVLTRCLSGALNGNIGVEKSIIAEITDETNIGQAYAYVPISWSTGSILGPLIGGTLSQPAENFPELFGKSEFLREYPYFLPCAVPAIFSIVACIVAFLFLKETVQNPLSIRAILGLRTVSADATNRVSTTDAEEKPLPLRMLLIPPVLIAGGNYAMISLIEIAFRGTQPLFFSTPISLGGLEFSTQEIGTVLSLTGLLNMVMQLFCFAPIHNFLGSKKTVMFGLSCGFPLFVCFPLLSWLAKGGFTTWLWPVVLLQVIFFTGLSFSYGAIFIYIAAASPNKASLGATNGLCQMSVSIFRAIGPAVATSLFSLSMQRNLLGGWLVYYILLLIVGLSLFISLLLPNLERPRK